MPIISCTSNIGYFELPSRLGMPRRHNMNTPSAALIAHHALSKRWHSKMVRLIVNVDSRVVMAVDTTRPNRPHAVLAHVGEIHRRAGVFLPAGLVAANLNTAEAMNVSYQDEGDTAALR